MEEAEAKRLSTGLSLDQVCELIKAEGPKTKKEIAEHFFGPGADLPQGGALVHWVSRGLLLLREDGRYVYPPAR